MVTFETDKGNIRSINQDRILVRHAYIKKKEVLMAIVCDGMGGLSNGELASAAVTFAFEKWFANELPYELENFDMDVISAKWDLLLKDLNMRILEYGQQNGGSMGTTFTGILFVDALFIAVHVGDSRLYYIGNQVEQMTSDHSFVAKEVCKGTLTREQAKVDKRRNMLLQCVGASKRIVPQIICGETKRGIYLVCSDGLWHNLNESEMLRQLDLPVFKSKRKMQKKCRQLIDEVRQCGERDNISVILIRAKL